MKDANSIGDMPAFAENGMTYRQWLLGLAIQGLLASPNVMWKEVEVSAFAIVDAVLLRLAKDSEAKK